MKISSRFTEFGMTGAFFWISQIILFSVVNGQALPDIISELVKLWNGDMIPAALKEAAGSLITVFGVIGIFVTGLILDLIGSYFAFLEMTIFNRHLKRNQDWLNVLSDQCSESIRRDYRKLRDRFGTDFVVTLKKVVERFGMIRECKHVQTFLFSYIHVFSSMSEMLVDNRHLWRTSRAISSTLLILAIEVIFLSSHGNLSDWVYIIVHLVLYGLSALITLRSYSRLCISLFSLACVTQKKESQNPMS